MKKMLCAAIAVLALVGCTTAHHSINKVSRAQHDPRLVCIEENPDVLVGEMLPLVQKGLERHGIKTMNYSRGAMPKGCDYTLWYTVSQRWDMVLYIYDAEIKLRHKGVNIASVYYRNGDYLNVGKWASTKSQIDPLMDELLADFETGGAARSRLDAPMEAGVSASPRPEGAGRARVAD